jgi:hypothetical protein
MLRAEMGGHVEFIEVLGENMCFHIAHYGVGRHVFAIKTQIRATIPIRWSDIRGVTRLSAADPRLESLGWVSY